LATEFQKVGRLEPWYGRRVYEGCQSRSLQARNRNRLAVEAQGKEHWPKQFHSIAPTEVSGVVRAAVATGFGILGVEQKRYSTHRLHDINCVTAKRTQENGHE